MRPSRLWPMLAAAVLGACDGEVALPSGVALRCAGDAECPQGLRCSKAFRCVPFDRLDEAPPALAPPLLLTPASGRRGAELAATFKVSRALGQDPEVWIEGPDGRHAFTLALGGRQDPARRGGG